MYMHMHAHIPLLLWTLQKGPTVQYMLTLCVCVQFNVTVVDEKQVSSELKHSLEGRLPQQDSPVCVEISMETLEVHGTHTVRKYLVGS